MYPEILERYPVLKPYIGENYINDHNKRVLIIGESHYLPKNEGSKSEPHVWYNSDLKKNKINSTSWITTEHVVNEFINNKKLKKGHTFFNRLSHSINRISGDLFDDHKTSMNHVSFLNFFPRPAKTGKSLKIDKRDIQNGKEVLNWFIIENEPEIIAVASKKAGKEVENLLANKNIAYRIVAHPASNWWYKKAKSYNNLSGKEVFESFLKDHGMFY
jgi:hypothetical protein